MKFLVVGIVAGIIAVTLQQDPASIGPNITVVIVAFLTGAFGTNGLARIIDALWGIKRMDKVREDLEEARELYQGALNSVEASQERMEELQRQMALQNLEHQMAMTELRKELGNK